MRTGKGPPHGGCRELGIVSGGGFGPSTSRNLESAQNELRNATADLGGDFVAYDVAASDINRISLSGRAFDCSVGPQEAAPTAVSSQTSGGPAAPAEPTSVEERLQKLDALHQKGLITDEERSKRREEILKGI